MADITAFPIPTEVLDPANYPEFVGPIGPAGPQGETGPAGPAGADGVGVPAGGTTGQVLAKSSGADYETQWVTPDTAFVRSNVTGITGADAVTNIVSLTQAEYNAIGTPNSSTLYIITG